MPAAINRLAHVVDNPVDGARVCHALAASGEVWEVAMLPTVAAATSELSGVNSFEVLLVDPRLSDGSGLDLLRWVRQRGIPVAVVMVTESGNERAVVEALQAGADAYWTKRGDHLARLPEVLRIARERHRRSRICCDRSIRVLYAEHDVAEAAVTRRLFAEHGARITLEVVPTESAALAALAERGRDAWDVLVLDHRPPGVGVLDMIVEIRDHRGLDLPVVLVTRPGGEDVAALALGLGADDYLVRRPGFVHELLARVERIRVGRELRREKEALQAGQERYRRLAESAPDLIFRMELRPERRFSYVSPAATLITGYTPEDHYADPDLGLKIVHPDDREALRAAESSREPLTLRWVHRDGHTIWTELRTVPVRDADGRIVAVEGIARDVTERKRMEAELLRAQRLESIGRLAGGLAHDLNNVLAPMLIAPAILRPSLRDREALVLVDAIESNARRGAAIIRQLLSFGRGGDGERSAVRLQDLVREMGVVIRETFPKNIDCRLECERDLPPMAVDATQMHQVLMNLCVNARDAMPGGGTLTLGLRRRLLDAPAARLRPGAREGSYLVLTVADTGCGIAPEHLERIFDPFFTTKPPGEGTGLGLATVLRIVHGHGGYVQVESAIGRGTTFEVGLPLPEGTTAAPPLAPRELPAGKGGTVLVVDDEPTTRTVLRLILRRSGYQVVEAGDGQAALDVFCERGGGIAAVITDVAMPRMDGEALLGEIWSLHPDMPVIVISGHLGHAGGLGPNASKAGAFLAKPFGAAEVLEALSSALAGARPHRD